MGYENSGRRPQSAAVRLLRGNPGKRRIPAELKPPPGEVVKPEGLSAPASAIWDELAAVCLAMGTLTTADLKPFRTLCELQATLDRASAFKTAGAWEEAIKVERQYAPIIRQYYALFGLEPVSRSRITVPKDDAPVNKWAGIA